MFNHPLLCNYYVTYRCNSRCIFCNIWKNTDNINIPDARLEDAEKNLIGLKKMGVKAIDFTGGEPLLNDDLPKILKYAKKLGFYVKLTTNGILYPKKANEIKGLVDWLSFSLESMDPISYKEIRGVDNFNNLLNCIKIAKTLKEKTFLIYTITNQTIHDFQKIIEFAKENKIFIYINPVFSYYGNEDLSTKYISYIKKQFWKPYIFIDLAYFEFLENNGNNIHKPKCKAGQSVVAISPDNCLLLPCYHHQLERIYFGNDLHSIYYSKKVQNILKYTATYPFCENCKITCYMGTSFITNLDRYFLFSIFSNAKFILERKIRKS